MTKIGYRPDIDGLRAFAVLAVVAYHAFPELLPGGFTGVDIFFVISGYLISGILYKGLHEGNFSFREFYARRVRRLFPSLLVVVPLCMAYGWLVLLPSEFKQMGGHVAAGAIFAQNIVFWQQTGYFDPASSLKPLQHLWTLAVEEQFYIFLPPLLMLIWKRRWPMVPILWLLLLASFIANLLVLHHDGSAVFFLTQYRAWEFLAGSLLAWHDFGKIHHASFRFAWALSAAGLGALIAGVVFAKHGEPYPGWKAILPVGGTVLLIAAGPSTWINRKLFSLPIVVWVGLISYPLYLFHWPAISFVHIVQGPKPLWRFLGVAVMVGFVLSVATYYLIEKKLRRSKAPATVPLLVATFIALGIAGLLAWQGIIPGRAPEGTKQVENAIADRDIFAGFTKTNPYNSAIDLYSIGEGPVRTVVLGDSNAMHYAPRFGKLVEDNPSVGGVMFVTFGGAPAIPGIERFDMPQIEELLPVFEKVIIDNPGIKRVVIAGLWHGYFRTGNNYKINGQSLSVPEGRDAALSAIGRLVAGLTMDKKQVTVVSSIPSGEELNPKAFVHRAYTGFRIGDPPPLPKETFLKHLGETNRRILEVARANGAGVIDPVDSLCSDGICISVNADGPIRFDADHLRPEFVRDNLLMLDAILAP